MKIIGIDANEANVVKKVGTGQYTYNILKHWARDPQASFYLYHRDVLLPGMPPKNKNWNYHLVKPKKMWMSFGLPLHLAISGIKHNVFWAPAHYAPIITRGSLVVTIHDLAYEYFPELFLPSDLYKLKNWTRAAVKKAAKVIAVSEATKKDLIKFYNVPAKKIVVVYNGFDSEHFNPKTKPFGEGVEPRVLPKEYILYVGTVQPRKNIVRLVKAFEIMKKEGYRGRLVIAGNIGWMAEDTIQTINNSANSKDILMTGYIHDDTRYSLYKYASVTVLPSLMEGFGVPLLESMAVGTPVAASNNSSLPEVVGDAGVLFDPLDPADIAKGINKVLKNREKYAKKGLLQAAKFSWEKCAKETLAVLESVGNK